MNVNTWSKCPECGCQKLTNSNYFSNKKSGIWTLVHYNYSVGTSYRVRQLFFSTRGTKKLSISTKEHTENILFNSTNKQVYGRIPCQTNS